MSIYFGNDTVNDLYIGLTPVSKGYVGTHLFYNGDSTIIDFTYEKYILNTRFSTLYNTEEAPLKNAILKGQTLVNMVPQDKQHTDGISNVNLTEGKLTWSTQSDWLKLYFVVNGKPNSKYIIKYQSINENVGIFCRPETTDPHSGWNENVTALNQIIYTYDVGTFVISLENAIASSDLWVQDFMIIEYQDGMENWDIPYFEGMKSVEMPVLKTTGKNIVGDLEIGGLDVNGNSNTITLYTRSGFILLKKDTTYTFSLNGVKRSFHLYLYDLNKNFKVKVGMANEYTPEVDCYIRVFQMDDLDKALYQVEKGTIATPYEPYKSNILMVNEDVTLRSNGDICDELNLLTGQLKQRIGEDGVVLSQEVVKTVDLSVVDQDGNNTKLSTFEDLTHVTLSSEGLIPEAELKVATKNEEVLNTMGLKMDDIYATQTTLEETSDAQSENVDATMIATTEIYEQLL